MAGKTPEPPKQSEFPFDLERAYASMVSLRTQIPSDAYTAEILGTERAGSGVMIRSHGVVLTIGYLVTEAETVWLTDHTGAAVPGHVLGQDQETGFGLVQALGRLNAEALPIGRSSSISEGDHLVLAGFGGSSGSIATHVVAIREFAGYWEYLLDEAIFTAPAHPNWGGTALVGGDGELLGVGSLFIQHGESENSARDGNMVVPIDLLEPIFDELATYGKTSKPSRPWLGLFGTEIGSGVVVAALSRNGPADRADVRVGDIVMGVGGRPVASLADLFRKVWALGPAGVSVPLDLGRDGELVEVTISSIARSDVLKGPKIH